MKLSNFSEYFSIITELDNRNVFTDKTDPAAFARFPLKKEVNNPNAQLKEFFDSLISRHQKRVTRVIKNRDCSNPLSAINSFILTNKLVIYSIVNDIELIQKLTHVKKNLEDFFNEKNCFLFLIPSKYLPELLKESQMKYHTAMLVFIIDYLQKQSKEFEPDNRLGYNPVKEVFEISTVTSLIQMISFENNIFERDIFEELIDQYAEIVTALSRYSVIDVERALNTLIESVEIKTGKKWEE